jgi:hypothetical protein
MPTARVRVIRSVPVPSCLFDQKEAILTKRTRLLRALPWFLGAAIVGGSPLAGCGSSQTSGPVENIPKESPVLGPGKDSAEAFFNKKGAKASNAPSTKTSK